MKRSFEEWKQMVGTQIGDYEIAQQMLNDSLEVVSIIISGSGCSGLHFFKTIPNIIKNTKINIKFVIIVVFICFYLELNYTYDNIFPQPPHIV